MKLHVKLFRNFTMFNFWGLLFMGRGGVPIPWGDGDWECPSCGANVFASKDACFKCGTPKGGSGGGGRDRDDRRGGGRDDRDGRRGGGRDDRDDRRGGGRDDRDDRRGGGRDRRDRSDSPRDRRR